MPMVRRKRRSVKQQRWLRVKQQAPISVGRSRDDLKREARAHRAAVIARNREAVFHRDRACRRCHLGHDDDQCHEVVSRAKLRNHPPDDIFTLVNCCRLCPRCHEMVTRNREFLVFATFHGCDDTISFVTRAAFHDRWPSDTRRVTHGLVVDQCATSHRIDGEVTFG